MTFQLDPDVAKALAPLFEGAADAAPPVRGDVASRRESVEAIQAMTSAAQPSPADVSMSDFYATAADGAQILLRWYEKEGSRPGSAVLYLHGGGMILSNVGLYDGPVSRYVSTTGVPFLSVEYRYAPEYPHPYPVEDSYAGLRWLRDNAASLGVDAERIAIMGDSGGGGVAAGLAIHARDAGGPAIAKQILIYPMLDDRNVVPDPELVPFATWTYDDNWTGWNALLGELHTTDAVQAAASPARLTDPTGLPPAYIEVGELDIFRDEDIEYALRLAKAGVPIELHVHPAVPHAWETFAFEGDVAKRSAEDRRRVIRSV